MNETDEKAIEQMKLALESCAGPVTRCPPGRARAPAEAGGGEKRLRAVA